MNEPKSSADYFLLNSTIKSHVSSVLALDGRAIATSLASITLFGVAAAHDLKQDPIQLLGFTFQAGSALFLIAPIIFVNFYLYALLYLGWKTEFEFFRLVWAKEIEPMVDEITTETNRRTEILKKNVQIIEISGIHSLQVFDIVFNLEKLTPDVKLTAIALSKEGREAAVSQYIESLLLLGRQYKEKYDLVDFGVWFRFVDDVNNVCSRFLEDFFRSDVLDEKVVGRERFIQKLGELSAKYCNPFGEALLDKQVIDLQSQADEANWWLSAWKGGDRRSALSFRLIIGVPSFLLLGSVVSVFFFRGPEMYKQLLAVV